MKGTVELEVKRLKRIVLFECNCEERNINSENLEAVHRDLDRSA